MSASENLTAMDHDIARLDDEMVAANTHHRDLVAQKESPEKIERAATERDVLMEAKMALEEEFEIRKQIVEKQFEIETEEDRNNAAAAYEKFRNEHKPISADEKQTLLGELNELMGWKPGMSDADILTAMDRLMAHIDDTIVRDNREYQEMLKAGTAAPEAIEEQASRLEFDMTWKMVLKEQMAKYNADLN
jgi:hypothetical protein